MKKRMSGLALALCLLLTACGGKREDRQGQVSFLGRAAGLEETEVLVTVGGREIPSWRYLYWLAYTCDQIQAQYEEAGLTLDWETAVTGGTLADYARDQALADTALYATVENWAEQYGCELNEEDRTALAESWEENAEARGGEEAYLAELQDLGLDRERAEELAAVGMLYAKLYALYEEADSPLASEEGIPASSAAAQLTLNRILISYGEDRETARQKAAEVFSQLNGAADQEAEFAALAAAGDDPAGPRTITVGDGTLDPALEEAALALEEGQCSGILESGEGFSILRRLPTDTGESTFDQLLQRAAQNAEVRTAEAYETVDVTVFFQELERLREAEAAS